MIPENAKRVIRPLWLVFWGGLACVVDLKVNELDLLPDVVGVLLVFSGVYCLADLSAHGPYRRLMQIVRLVAALSVFGTFYGCTSFKPPVFMQAGLLVLGVAEAGAAVGFCVAMRWLCEAYGLDRSAQSWRSTTLLFTLLCLVPLAFVNLTQAAALVAGDWFHFELGPLALLLLAAVVPLVHLFVSTSRMIGEAEKLASVGTLARLAEAPETPRRPIQFTLRTLLVVTAAMAILGGFLARPNVYYWHVSFVGLVLLGVAVFALGMRKPAWGIWIGAALLLMIGSSNIGHSSSSGTYGKMFATPAEYASCIERLEPWLLDEGFEKTDSSGTFLDPPSRTPLSSRPARRYYVRRSSAENEILVVLDEDPEARFLDLYIAQQSKGFAWYARDHFREADRFRERLKQVVRGAGE